MSHIVRKAQSMQDRIGLLDKDYALGRKVKPGFIFNYKVRANIAAHYARKYISKSTLLNVLDFGSAEGLTLLEFNLRMPEAIFTGVEYSGELLQCAPELPPNISLIWGDIRKLPDSIEDSSYDLVCALAILEHLPDPIVAIQEGFRVLRPGGIFIATCPNPFWDFVAISFGFFKGNAHFSNLGRAEMTYFIEKTGFNVVAFERFSLAPISLLAYLKLPISASYSLKLDNIIRKLGVFNWLFLNQCIVASK